ncbi:MAG: type II secretion system GspH family protein [Heliobacteriaceae bacterium]|jgi:prepilin-type N-terminal cleavage/methylation domain-containing protein|nr:type II secretion system GspH family protein [Heliobacteriaceae bacterium]
MSTKNGFTLAEVLITLGIIGVVAALTMPALISNYQQMVVKTQFKKAYAVLQNAWGLAESDGESYECYYWKDNPYGGHHCDTYDAQGECTHYIMDSGGELPADVNGKFDDCGVQAERILANLNIVQTCQNNAYSGGCIPDYEGLDTVVKAGGGTDYQATQRSTGCTRWRKSNIRTMSSAHVLADGTIILGYGAFYPRAFAVDVNGKKGPNKWGHDLFSFAPKGNSPSKVSIAGGTCMQPEQGGVTTAAMIENMHK